MALFYKYAKALNEIHTLYKSGATKEQLARLSEKLSNELHSNEDEQKKAQEQLVIYAPFVEKELQKPEYKGKALSSLYFSMGLGTPEQIETYNKVLDECIARYDIGEVLRKEPGSFEIKKFNPEEKDGEIESFANMAIELFSEEVALVPYSPLKALTYIYQPKDNLNMMAFSDFEQLIDQKHNGQIKFNPNGSGVICGLNFDELGEEVKRTLDIFDKRVFEILSTVFYCHMQAGFPDYPHITLTKIYKAMGHSSTPNSDDLEKIEKSIRKMMCIWLFIDNANVRVKDKNSERGYKDISESKTEKKIKEWQYDGHFVNAKFEKCSVVKGGVTDKLVKILDLPGLFEYAIRRNTKIMTIETALLDSPINKTSKNMMIEDYLITRINEMIYAQKTPGYNKKNTILFKTVLEYCNIKTKNPGRYLETVCKLLDFYKEKKYIKDYSNEDKYVFKITLYPRHLELTDKEST